MELVGLIDWAESGLSLLLFLLLIIRWTCSPTSIYLLSPNSSTLLRLLNPLRLRTLCEGPCIVHASCLSEIFLNRPPLA